MKRLIRFMVAFSIVVLLASCKGQSTTPIRTLTTSLSYTATSRPTHLPPTWTPVAKAGTFTPLGALFETSTPRPSRTPWPTGDFLTAETINEATATLYVSPSSQDTTQTEADIEITPEPTPFSPIEMTVNDPSEFPAIWAQQQANGFDLAYTKIGFHVSVGGDERGLGEWMQRLDDAGVPFFLKSVDYAGPIYEAQQLMKASGVQHTLVFRSIGDLPDYDLPPEEAALKHWQYHIERFPPELDRRIVWMETVNEVDHERTDWLARFSSATARLALAGGYRWAAFGWSSGEPEPYDWELPSMLFFLRTVGLHMDRLAIAVHEYSGTTRDIMFEYPDRIGRFMQLYHVCDRYDIPRPTVLITEWGWTYNNVPSVQKAMSDIAWASRLYAAFPQVKGAAIWHLGGGKSFGDIAHPTQKLIQPITDYSLSHYFVIPPTSSSATANPGFYLP